MAVKSFIFHCLPRSLGLVAMHQSISGAPMHSLGNCGFSVLGVEHKQILHGPEFGGGGGVRSPGSSRGEGGGTIKSLSWGQYHFVFELSLNIASYRPGRSFLGHK